MVANFYKFAKRENSTKRPSSAASTLNITLKGPCSIIAPSIVLDVGGTSRPDYNYAYLPDFARYYFIADWTWDRGLWTATLSEDMLATWRTDIGSAQEFVVRSSYESDGGIVDGAYETELPPVVGHEYLTSIAAGAGGLGDGSFIVGIINPDGAAVGGVSYYIMTPANYRTLCSYLLEGSLSDIFQNLTEAEKYIFDPFKYISTAMWFPWTFADLKLAANRVTSLKAGWWSLNLSGFEAWRLDGSYTVYTGADIEVTLPTHPQAATRGQFLRGAPFSDYTIEVWPFGIVPLDANRLSGFSKIEYRVRADLVTGDGYLYIFAGNSGEPWVPIDTRAAAVGVSMQISQITMPMPDSVAGVTTVGLKSIAAGVARFAEMGADYLNVGTVPTVKQQALGVGDAVAAANALPQSTGVRASTAAYTYAPVLHYQFYNLTEEDNEQRGRPLLKKRTLSSIPGFILCADPDVQFAGTAEELAGVKAYMAAGFFYE